MRQRRTKSKNRDVMIRQGYERRATQQFARMGTYPYFLKEFINLKSTETSITTPQTMFYLKNIGNKKGS